MLASKVTLSALVFFCLQGSYNLLLLTAFYVDVTVADLDVPQNFVNQSIELRYFVKWQIDER